MRLVELTFSLGAGEWDTAALVAKLSGPTLFDVAELKTTLCALRAFFVFTGKIIDIGGADFSNLGARWRLRAVRNTLLVHTLLATFAQRIPLTFSPCSCVLADLLSFRTRCTAFWLTDTLGFWRTCHTFVVGADRKVLIPTVVICQALHTATLSFVRAATDESSRTILV